MPVPKFFEFFKVFLEAVKDKNLHSSKEVREIIAEKMNLTEEDREELLPSGKQTTYDNRVAWARTYLDKAGLIETPARGQYRITEEGINALASGEEINLKYLEQYDSFKKFHSSTTTTNRGKQAQKGLFITTTKFSSEAIDYARNLLGQKVVLVDGDSLTRLMIKHNVGVSVEHVYELKRVDSDFFADEL